MGKAAKQYDAKQKKQLLQYARDVVQSFQKGVILSDDPNPFSWENGANLFDGFAVRYTEDYLRHRRDFTLLACKMLNSKAAHENTIRKMCQKAGQTYVKLRAKADHEAPEELQKTAQNLVDEVLSDAGKEYVHIEPNYLVRHAAPNIVTLGRVRSMKTELGGLIAPLSEHSNVKLKVADHALEIHGDGTTVLGMPSSIWVVEAPATKENVVEEAKWLIDVAVSFMRLSVGKWDGLVPSIGDVEPLPTAPGFAWRNSVTLEGDKADVGGGKAPSWYEINSETADVLSSLEVQNRAVRLFDPIERSLAERVAQGLGWMTRGRQLSDRAERLVSFFTALEALLTSNDKSEPVVQTICRHVSVIYTQNLTDRITVFNHIKALYGLRSDVIHRGKREVFWQDVNKLQAYVETVFRVVLNRCDLAMTQDHFAQSLATASHGLRWELAAPK